VAHPRTEAQRYACYLLTTEGPLRGEGNSGMPNDVTEGQMSRCTKSRRDR